MDLLDITACVLVKNEANFINHILYPLANMLGDVIIFDTGSTDGTIEKIQEMGLGDNLTLKGDSNPVQIGTYRTDMNQMAKTPWTMIVDGDELYPIEMLAEFRDYEIPDGKTLGFTKMCSVDFVDGKYVLLDDYFSRLAFHPRTMRYHHNYPFESPVDYDPPHSERLYFYVNTQLTSYHLHRLNRSPLDGNVFMRKDKQYLYGMSPDTKAILGPVELPLCHLYEDPYKV